jgi:outer membrane protein
MKKSILAIAFFALCFSLPSVVQAQKVAHLNFQEIIILMPEYKTASTEYELYQSSLEDELKSIETEAMALNKKYEEESKKPAPSQTKLKLYAQSLENMQQSYQEMQQSIQDSLKAKMAELVAPIKKKIEAVVADIAKEKGYSHVLDNSYGMLIYADEEHNLDKAVKDRLKIVEKPTTNPGAGRPGGAGAVRPGGSPQR